MKLIFIRHGDPDYKNNTVTEKGKREVRLLTERVCKWNVTDFFVSSYGRAQDTIRPSLEKMGRTVEICPWLREFDAHVMNPATGKEKSVPWDWLPEQFFGEEKYHSFNEWFNSPVMKSGPVRERYEEVVRGFDEVLSRYGYVRKDKNVPVYTCKPHMTEEEAEIDTHLDAFQKNLDETNLVFTCHLGVMFVIIGYLTGISPVQLWQGFFVAPTSVTVMGCQEREPGKAVFRTQFMGDIRHLTEGGEPASASGFYGNFENF